MEWLFEGLGTFLIGLVLGAGGCQTVHVVRRQRSVKQRQKAGDHASQIQAGRDVKVDRPSD